MTDHFFRLPEKKATTWKTVALKVMVILEISRAFLSPLRAAKSECVHKFYLIYVCIYNVYINEKTACNELAIKEVEENLSDNQHVYRCLILLYELYNADNTMGNDVMYTIVRVHIKKKKSII